MSLIPATLRTRRTRRRRDTAPVGRTLVRGLVTIGLIVAFIVVAVTAIDGVPFVNYTRVHLEVPSIGNLRQHDEVEINGVRVGQVQSESTTNSGADVLLQIDPGTVLPKGTTAMVRANGLLGAREVQMIPGHGLPDLKSGDTIKASSDALTYGIPDLLDTFNQQTRGNLGTGVNNLGLGFLGNGARLNSAIGAVTPATLQFSQLAEAVLAQGGAAARLLPALESMMSPLASVRDQITNLLVPGSSALQPFVDHRAATDQSIAQAPSTLDSAQYGLSRGTTLVDAAHQLADAANQALPSAPSGLVQATKLLTYAHGKLPGGGTPLTRVGGLLDSVRPAVPAVLHITRALRPALPRVNTLAKLGTPIVKQVNPFGCNVINFAEVLRSMTGFGGVGSGPSGPAMEFRLQVVADPSSFGIADPVGHRTAYAPPCSYIGGTYPVTPGTGLALPGSVG